MYITGGLIIFYFYHCILSFPNFLPLQVVVLKNKKSLHSEQMFISFNGPVTSGKDTICSACFSECENMCHNY